MKKNPNILLRMHTKEARSGITRTDVDCGFCKFLKLVYIISFIYTIGIKLIYLLSVYMQADSVVGSIGLENLSTLQEEQLSAVKNSMILVSIMTLVIIAGFVLLLRRVHWPALFMSSVPSAVLLIHFAERMSDTLAAQGLASSYTYNHLIPLLLLTVTSVIYSLVGIRFNISENKAYTSFVNGLYSRYSSNFENLTDEQWNQFLDTYEPPKPVKQKRSQKAAARKAQEEAAE